MVTAWYTDAEVGGSQTGGAAADDGDFLAGVGLDGNDIGSSARTCPRRRPSGTRWRWALPPAAGGRRLHTDAGRRGRWRGDGEGFVDGLDRFLELAVLDLLDVLCSRSWPGSSVCTGRGSRRYGRRGAARVRSSGRGRHGRCRCGPRSPPEVSRNRHGAVSGRLRPRRGRCRRHRRWRCVCRSRGSGCRCPRGPRKRVWYQKALQ